MWMHSCHQPRKEIGRDFYRWRPPQGATKAWAFSARKTDGAAHGPNGQAGFARSSCCGCSKIMEEDQKRPITVLPVIKEGDIVVGLIKMHDIIQSGV